MLRWGMRRRGSMLCRSMSLLRRDGGYRVESGVGLIDYKLKCYLFNVGDACPASLSSIAGVTHKLGWAGPAIHPVASDRTLVIRLVVRQGPYMSQTTGIKSCKSSQANKSNFQRATQPTITPSHGTTDNSNTKDYSPRQNAPQHPRT